MKRIYSVFTVVIFIVSCSVDTSANVVTVKGAEYNYDIPIEYVYNKNKPSNLYTSEEKKRFDKTGSILLNIEQNINGQSIDILTLLYSGKLYPKNHLHTLQLREYELAGVLDEMLLDDGIYVATKEIKDTDRADGSTQIYFSTIDPHQISNASLNDDDFYGKIRISRGLDEIPGVIIKNRPNCEFKILNDGLLYHSSFPGNACKLELIHEFKKIHDKMISDWRVLKS